MIAFDNKGVERCARCPAGARGKLKVQDSFLLRDHAGRRAIPDALRELPQGARIRLRACVKCGARVWTVELAVKLED